MVDRALIANVRQNMLDTLADLASIERQRDYERKVPFVDVPAELACQWDEHSTLLSTQPWFVDSLTAHQKQALSDFNNEYKTVMAMFDQTFPDLSTLETDIRWNRVVAAANAALQAFR